MSVHRSMEAAAADWQQFEAVALTTVYQTHLWCRAWQDTRGAALGTQPRIAVVRTATGDVAAILPLQIRRRAGVRVVEWLGSPDAGYGYGLFSAEALATAGAWAPLLLPRILAAAGDFDVAVLADMPGDLFGARHPLSHAFTLRSANLSFHMRLQPDFDALHAERRSSDDRRTARKKESGLARLGALDFGLPVGRAAVHETLDLMFAQQKSRMAEIGVHSVASPSVQAFFRRLADLQDEARPLLLPYRLRCGGETLAVMLGGFHAGTYWALISSLAPGAARKYSPGDLALRRTIRACCEAGLACFDFSAGDAAYKRAWADTAVMLHHHVAARTLRGMGFAAAMTAQMVMKRWLKTTPLLFRLSLALRRAIRGKAAVSP